MKYSITHYLAFFVAVALLSGSVGCRLNGPFYHPSAWQFYNPFKGDSEAEYADNVFDELPGEPKSQPPESLAKLDSPSVAKPSGGYGSDFNNRAVAFSTTQSNSSINVDTKDKNTIGVQDGLFANRSLPPTGVAANGPNSNGVGTGSTASVATQTPSVIARNSSDQPWNLPSGMNEPNAGFASTQTQAQAQTITMPQQHQFANAQPPANIPSITPNYSLPTNAAPMESISSTAPITGTTYPTSGFGMQPGVQQQPVMQQPTVPQQPVMQQPITQQPAVMQQQPAPAYNGYSTSPSVSQNTGFQPTPIPEQTPANYSSGFNSFAPNTTDSYRPGSAY